MDATKEIISRLKFLNHIKKSTKIDTKQLLMQPDNIITVINRSFIRQDNRANTLAFIHDTIENSYQLVKDHISFADEYNRTFVLHLLKDLQNAKTGIMNIKETYATDVKFCCDLMTLVEELDSQLKNFQQIVLSTTEETSEL